MTLDEHMQQFREEFARLAEADFPGLESPFGRQQFADVIFPMLYEQRCRQYYQGLRHKPVYDREELLRFLTQQYMEMRR